MTNVDIRKQNASRLLRGATRYLFAGTALIGTGTVVAAGFSIGVGAGAGVDRGGVDCIGSFPCDRSSAHGKLFAAYHLNDAVDVQAVVFDAGRFKGGDTTPLGTEFGGNFKVSGFGVTGGYRWALAPVWSLAARAGVAAVRTRFDYARADVDSASKTTLQPLAGLGLTYAITPNVRLGLDYDVTRMKVHTTRGSLQMLGLAAQYSF